MGINSFIYKMDYYKETIKRNDCIIVDGNKYVFDENFKDIEHFLQYVSGEEFQLILDTIKVKP